MEPARKGFHEQLSTNLVKAWHEQVSQRKIDSVPFARSLKISNDDAADPT